MSIRNIGTINLASNVQRHIIIMIFSFFICVFDTRVVTLLFLHVCSLYACARACVCVCVRVYACVCVCVCARVATMRDNLYSALVRIQVNVCASGQQKCNRTDSCHTHNA
jgi:hypothetical protein